MRAHAWEERDGRRRGVRVGGGSFCLKKNKTRHPKEERGCGARVLQAEARYESAREHARGGARRPEEGLYDGPDEVAAPAAKEQKREDNGYEKERLNETRQRTYSGR